MYHEIHRARGVENFNNDEVLNLSFRTLMDGQSAHMEEQDSSILGAIKKLILQLNQQ